MRTRDLLRLAGVAGVAAGLIEGLYDVGMQAMAQPVRAPLSILWMAPAFNAVLFLAAGIGLLVVTAPRPLAKYRPLAIVILVWMFAYGLIQTTDRISPGPGLILALGIGVASYRARPRPEWWSALAARAWRPIAIVATMVTIAAIVWPQWREERIVDNLPEATPGRPNVVLITLDTLRADHLSAYGYHRSTPNLDALANRGVLFEHAFSNSSWTLPAHASLLTGRYPHEHGGDWLQPMNRGVTSIGEVLTRLGYATAAITANTSYVAPEWGIGRGFSRFDAYGPSLAAAVAHTTYGKRLALNLLPRAGYFDVPGRRGADRVNDEVLSWIDSVEVGRPFFAMVNYLDVHDPYITGEPDHSRYSPGAARGDVINFQFQPHSFRRKAVLSDREIAAEIDAYDGCLAFLDREIGFLIEEFERRDLIGNTIVVITSDHGEAFGNHDLFGHGNSLYAEVLRVPLMIVWPGHVPTGARVRQVAGLNQVPATILDLVGSQEARRLIPGQSLVPLFAGDAPDLHGQPVLSEVSGVDGAPAHYPTSAGSMTSLITDDWHLVTPAAGAAQLFNWREDPEERVNLMGQPQGAAAHPGLDQILKEMRGSQPQ